MPASDLDHAPKRQRVYGVDILEIKPLTSPPSKAKVHPVELRSRIAKCIGELSCCGIRSWSSGVFIQDYNFTLWYMDRMGLVRSCSFDFIEEPHYLVLFLAAIMSASFQTLGFCPLLNFPFRTGSETPLDRFENAALTLPAAQTIDETLHKDLHFLLDVSEERSLISTYAPIGRATVVVPIRPAQNTSNLFGDGKLMAKISWQLKERTGEDVNACLRRKNAFWESEVKTKGEG